MSRKKQKFYVVWAGHNPGIYTSWEYCKRETDHFDGARFKSFATEEEAKHEFMLGTPSERSAEVKEYARQNAVSLPQGIEERALAVDAACSGNPGKMEYRGVFLQNRREIFHYGPVWGTNNIGEFLAIVHALAMFAKTGSNTAIYSDSRTAQAWVRDRMCRTKVASTPANANLLAIVKRAETWVQTHTWSNPIIKWQTEKWGEIPADFGRK